MPDPDLRTPLIVIILNIKEVVLDLYLSLSLSQCEKFFYTVVLVQLYLGTNFEDISFFCRTNGKSNVKDLLKHAHEKKKRKKKNCIDGIIFFKKVVFRRIACRTR